jgi:hypothetical protein
LKGLRHRAEFRMSSLPMKAKLIFHMENTPEAISFRKKATLQLRYQRDDRMQVPVFLKVLLEGFRG